MYKEILRSIEGIASFPVVAILIFFAFFVILLIYVISLEKGKVKHLSHIPLERDETTHTSTHSTNGIQKL